MATFRMLLKIATPGSGNRSWDEQFYIDNPASTVVGFPFLTAQLAGIQRALCLPRGVMILYARINTVNEPKIVRQIDLNFPGTLGPTSPPPADLVNVSRLIILRSAGGSVAKHLSRCPADGDVIDGQFTFAQNGPVPYNTWRDYFVNRPFKLRRAVFAASLAINGVSSAGIDFVVNPGLPIGTLVNVRTRTVGNGPKVYATVKTTGLNVAPSTTPIANWRFGNCVGGNARVVTYAYDDIISATTNSPSARTRKTGGPVGKFRGKRSRR